VVAVGLTLVEPLASVDAIEPGRIVMLDAPLVAQLRVALEPALILPGFAPKEVMTGVDPPPEADGFELPEPPQLVRTTQASSNARKKLPGRETTPVPADASWQVAKLGVFRANPSMSTCRW
jgi:hypothetical protein